MRADPDSHPVRFQPHLFTLYDRMPWRFIDNLPVEWSHLICRCDRFNWVTNYDDPGKQPPKCGTCKKVSINNFNKCGGLEQNKGCGKFFIRNFTHPSFCLYCDQLCWDCIMAQPVTENGCCTANSWQRRRFFEVKDSTEKVRLFIREPRGIYQAGKQYSADELYDLPDFSF